MDNSRVIPKRESLQVTKNDFGGYFGSKATFTVGSSYLGFAVIGLLAGAITIKKPKFILPTKRLLFSYYMKNMGQTSITYANNAGGAALLYIMSSFFTSFFEEQLINVNNLQRNAMIGFMAGNIYKCTRGWRAALMGGAVGMGLTVSLNLVTDYLRDRDIIKFEMRFDG